jgi:endonuclease III
VPQVFNAIPDNFPGHDALVADGVIFIENVPTTGAELVAIPGIGAATANKILTLQKT